MKKWCIPVIIALILTLAMPVFADEEPLNISHAQGKAGDTVFLTVSIRADVTGDTVGISYEYDHTLLEALPDQCSWSVEGVLEDFGTRRDSGAWCAAAPKSLKGELCVLAFRIRPGAELESASVSCTVTVKQGQEQVATYTAWAVVTQVCTHSYGPWQDQGALGHSHSCALCGLQQTQSHSWDGGKITPHPDQASLELQTFTCTVCGAQKVNEIPAEQRPTVPVITVPQQSAPTLPVYRPSQTQPGGSGSQGTATLPQGTVEHDHTHADGTQTAVPSDPPPMGLIAVLVVAAVMICGAVWFVKKK